MTQQLGQFCTSLARTHVGFQFSTHAAAGGNVAPNSAFEAADLRIYRSTAGAAFSATQRSSASGITMTSPFDSLTGVHDVDIDLTDNTDSGFYAAGYRYTVMLCPDETVDGQTITGIVLATFEIVSPRRMWINIGGQLNERGGRILFVSTSGNDSNLGTFDSPKLTGQGAVDAASSFDTIQFGEGLFTGQITIPETKIGLTLRGVGWGQIWDSEEEVYAETGTRLKYATGVQYDWVVFLTSHCTLENLLVAATGANRGTGVSGFDQVGNATASFHTDITIKGCKVTGYWDALYFPLVPNLKLIDVIASGTYDALNLAAGGGLIQNCRLSTDGSHTSGMTDARVIVWDAGNIVRPLRIVDSELIATRTANTPLSTIGIFTGTIAATVQQSLVLENTRIAVSSTHASATGEVAGIRHISPSPPTFPTVNSIAIEMYGGSITTSRDGSGTLSDIKIDTDASNIAVLHGTIADSAKCAGTVRFEDANTRAIFGKLPSKPYFAGSGNPDGDVEMNEATGNFGGSVASVAGAVGSVTGNVGGNVVGSVASVSGAVGSVTGSVGGNVTGSIGSLATQAKADVNAEADAALSDIGATSARMGYLANLNIGGAAASSAEITALNQSASRRIILTSLQQFERPESGSSTFTIEARTYDGDGAATNADSTPTLTATGNVTGSLAANLSSATNPATGVYRWTYTVANDATLEQILFGASATIGGGTFTLSLLAQTCDFVAATFTTADRQLLEDAKAAAELVEARLGEPSNDTFTQDFQAMANVNVEVSNKIGAPDTTLAAAAEAAAASAASADAKGTTINEKTSQLTFTDGKVEANAEAVVGDETVDSIVDGVVEGIGSGGASELADFDNTEIVEARVSKVGTRRDGVYTAFPTQRFIRGERGPFWIDLADLTGGKWIRDVTNPATDDAALAVDACRKHRQHVVVWLDYDVEPGDYTFQCKVQPRPGIVVIVEQPIVVAAPLVEEAS